MSADSETWSERAKRRDLAKLNAMLTERGQPIMTRGQWQAIADVLGEDGWWETVYEISLSQRWDKDAEDDDEEDWELEDDPDLECEHCPDREHCEF
jgi:hypothetical protein